MKYPRHVQKLFRTQERLIRQSNNSWAAMVRAEYSRQWTAHTLYGNRTMRLNRLAQCAHNTLVACDTSFGWSAP